ncbi:MULTISPECIES: hypothetical protein [unclassified Rhodococcus (in: high G+C Gram-positive bacteria)]|uniref:hypothetical protein n=1 Tax=unclassified Rhodococcus (in: high G+C Gram-positive bacteria) TaxID=192944 RepID=UPI000B9C2103|nr:MULTISPECIES: hypothetical protein [unclassified Rhodococcus (in: high G+C Gram-positive bacteria)]OZE32851.1 hypothetical protein CH259_20590 [Rhodococcus sp. 05-2254-4]OZE44253.1 hypothetical protein CH261_18065 [Rhodococcus sp. 05-2254-3]OZE56064.1 hypothetical protein CH283_00855 [Rhodococcus sp. 05-2254-2]
MRARLVAAATVCLLVAGCSAAESSTEPTTEAATPAAEPAQAPDAADPIGTVVPLAGAPEGVAVGSSGIAAAGVREPDGVVLFDAATGAVRQMVSTTGAPRHLSLAGPDGPVLVPLEGSDELLEISLADGAILSTATGVGRQPHDAVQTSDGTVVATNEMGGGVIFLRDGAIVSELPPGPVQPGGAAALGPFAAVADVQGNGVWVYDGATQQEVSQAPIGVKLTHAVTVNQTVAGFADTDGGAVLLASVDDAGGIRQIASIDAPGNPYGLAVDLERRLLFVTLTASNVLRVVDVSDPAAPRILGDVPTVTQANSVAVDPRNGDVLVTGSDPGAASSIQIIPRAELPVG